MKVYRLFVAIPYENESHVGLFSSLEAAKAAGKEYWSYKDVEFSKCEELVDSFESGWVFEDYDALRIVEEEVK